MAKAPGIDFNERDQSTVVTADGDTIGAIAFYAKKGRLNERQYITDTKAFRDQYGDEEPDLLAHYCALVAIEEAPCWCLRVPKSGAEPEFAGMVVRDEDSSFDNEAFSVGIKELTDYSFGGDDVMIITADNQGEWGSGLRVALSHDANDAEVFVLQVFAPDADGNYSQVGNDYLCSRVQLKKDGFGKSMYVEDVINDQQLYIRVRDNKSIAESVMPKENTTEIQLAGGDDGDPATASDIATAWDTYFKNKNAVSFTVGMAGGYTGSAIANELALVASTRQDCECIIDLSNSQSAVTLIAERDTFSLVGPSYSNTYAPWVQVEDRTNNKLVEIPLSGFICAAIARKNKSGEPHDAIFGPERGVLASGEVSIKKVVVDFDEPTQDLLANSQINSIVNFPGEGILIWGGRTLQPLPESARSWRSVRERLNVDETASRTFLRRFIGRNNDAFTRLQVKSGLDSYFEPLIGNGYYDVLVVCDETNNPSSVIDAGDLVVDIYVQPFRDVNRIKFQVTITRTGVSLSEVAAA